MMGWPQSSGSKEGALLVFFNSISVINTVLKLNYWKTCSCLGSKDATVLLLEAEFSFFFLTPITVSHRVT